MKKLLLLCAVLLVPVCVSALEKPIAGPQDRGFPADYHEVKTTPEAGKGIQKHAQDGQEGAQENFGLQPIHDNELFAVFRGDRLEYQSREGNEVLLWDVQAWVGSDYNKLYFKSEGTYLLDEDKADEIETELLYSRNIASFWDLQIGVRHDFRPDPDRTFAAFGVQGLAPLWFEVDATAYVSEDGDISASLEAEYDLLLSQRLILQPRFATSIAVQEVKKYGVGRGINDIELGLRLRYEIRRKFAPYIGVCWNRKIGDTADLAEADGEDTSVVSFVAGVRMWF
ncbi:MAG: copper resistance protein B [Desulfuromonadaceae bacterium]|nr:copper resistance protein B [Desulfuromonadaceae bacterium]